MSENSETSTVNNTTTQTQEKKMESNNSSRNPFVFISSSPVAGHILTGGVTAVAAMLAFFLFRSSPAEKKTKGADDTQGQPQQQQVFQQAPPQGQNQQPQYVFVQQPAAPQTQPQNLGGSQPVAGYLPAGGVGGQGQTVSTSFIVASAGRNRTGLIFLNDTPDYKIARNTVVVKSPNILGVYANNLDALKGRIITVTGTQGSYNGRSQIEATQINVQ